MVKVKKKMRKILTVVIMSSFLVSCSNKQEQNIIINENEISKRLGFQESKNLREKLSVEEFKILVPENGSVNSFCVCKDMVYYSVEFGDYLLEQKEIGGEGILFEDKYNTQIRAFCTETREDNLVYQYNTNECISVSDIQCNGKELVWEEYQNSTWNIKLFLLGEAQKEPITAVSQKQDAGQMESITLTITKDGLYWYNQSESEKNPISLYKYDFTKKEQTVEKKELALKSPYEHINIRDEVKSVYTKKEDNINIIQLCEGLEILNLEVDMEVSSPIANKELCIWMKGYDFHERQELYCFDREKQTTYCMPTSYTFAYEVLGDMILLNQEDEIVCYDIATMEKTPLTEGERGYGFLFSGMEGNIYAEIFDGTEESEILHIINIKEK